MTRPTAKDSVYAASTHCRVLVAAAEVGPDRGAGQVGDRGVEQVHDVGDEDDGEHGPAPPEGRGLRLGVDHGIVHDQLTHGASLLSRIRSNDVRDEQCS